MAPFLLSHPTRKTREKKKAIQELLGGDGRSKVLFDVSFCGLSSMSVFFSSSVHAVSVLCHAETTLLNRNFLCVGSF